MLWSINEVQVSILNQTSTWFWELSKVILWAIVPAAALALTVNAAQVQDHQLGAAHHAKVAEAAAQDRTQDQFVTNAYQLVQSAVGNVKVKLLAVAHACNVNVLALVEFLNIICHVRDEDVHNDKVEVAESDNDVHVATHNTGVVKAGDVASTIFPVHVVLFHANVFKVESKVISVLVFHTLSAAVIQDQIKFITVLVVTGVHSSWIVVYHHAHAVAFIVIVHTQCTIEIFVHAVNVLYSNAVAQALAQRTWLAVHRAVKLVHHFATVIAVQLHVQDDIVHTVVILVVHAQVDSAVFSTLHSHTWVLVTLCGLLVLAIWVSTWACVFVQISDNAVWDLVVISAKLDVALFIWAHV